MSVTQRRNQKLAGIAVLGAVALNYPFVSLFNQPAASFPLLYVYVFVIWALLIVLTGLVVDRRGKNSKTSGE